MPNGSKERDFPSRVGPRRRGAKFLYHTHEGAWGCIYDRDADMEAVAMVNEFKCKGLTRRMVNRLNAGTL